MDVVALSNSLCSIVNRHEVLRSIIKTNANGIDYLHLCQEDLPILTHHCSDESAYQALLQQEVDQPFNLRSVTQYGFAFIGLNPQIN